MNLSIGIVGLPNVGKSTLFSCLTKKQVAAENFPFTTIEPNVGIVALPDERLAKLTELVKPEKTVPTTVKFTDIAGLVKGAHQGGGLGNKFLANIREVDAILLVTRAFTDANVSHIYQTVEPERDIEIIITELALADLATVESSLERTTKKTKSGDADALVFLSVLEKIKKQLQSGGLVIDLNFNEEELPLVKSLNLLTFKKFMYVVNVDEQQQKQKVSFPNLPAPNLIICAKLEADLAGLSPREAAEFLQDAGISQNGLDQLIKASYELLGLITFFTAGPKEVRAWTIKGGAKAPEAAGAIHSDFAKNFIRAEVISYADYISAGSELASKDQGKMRIEGKDYVVADGDVIYFRV